MDGRGGSYGKGRAGALVHAPECVPGCRDNRKQRIERFGFQLREIGIRELFLRNCPRRNQTLQKTRAGRPDSGCALGLKVGRRTRLDGGGAARRIAGHSQRSDIRLRRQLPLSEQCGAAERKLPQFYTAARLAAQGGGAVPPAKHTAHIGNQPYSIAARRRKRHSLYFRKGRKLLFAIHDRRVSGHLLSAMGEFHSAARKLSGSGGRRFGAFGGRRETVDISLARRRLADSSIPRKGAVRGGQGYGRAARHQLAKS